MTQADRIEEKLDRLLSLMSSSTPQPAGDEIPPDKAFRIRQMAQNRISKRSK